MAGLPQVTYGRLLADTTRAGDLVPLDPATAGELPASDPRPAFVLSTEREATDGNILRQFWDLSRAAPDSCGAPVLWNHDPDILLGQWQDVAVQELDGRVLIGRAFLDPADELAQKRRAQIKSGVLRGVSVRWIPGATLRRGSLAADDPAYADPVDDPYCGEPEEGFVMGTERVPNVLLEASLTSLPADGNVRPTERMHARGTAGLQRLADSEAELDAVLATLSGNPRVQRWFERQFDRISALRGLKHPDQPPSRASLADLFGAS